MIRNLLFIVLSINLVGAAPPLLGIGDITIPLTEKTRCSAIFKNRKLSMCACCLVQQHTYQQQKTHTTKGLSNCLSQELCSTVTLNALNPERLKLEGLSTKLARQLIRTPVITVSGKYFEAAQSDFSAMGLAQFISDKARSHTFKSVELNNWFKNQDCLSVKKIGGGKQTLQIFRVNASPDCKNSNFPQHQKSWIIKETKKYAELKNLQILLNSPLAAFDIANPRRNQLFPAIAFPREMFTYNLNHKPHYMAVMDSAPGLPFSSFQDAQNLKSLAQASFLLGEKLGALHKEFMKPGNRLLGQTLVHGDFHMNNVFIDLPSKTVTLIDVETFIKSVKSPATPAVDIIMLYGFAIAHLQSSQQTAKTVPLAQWHQNFLRPFLERYISNWPKNQQYAVLRELRSFFVSPATFARIFKNRFLALNYLKYAYIVNRYAKPVFNDLRAKYSLEHLSF